MGTKLPDVICPECGSKMVLRTTWKYFYPAGDPRKFYGCSRHPDCKATHGAHPNGQPLGVPADRETKALRIKVHDLLDPLWKERGMKRNEAYQMLRSMMGWQRRQKIHVGELTKNQCELAIAKLEEYWQSIA